MRWLAKSDKRGQYPSTGQTDRISMKVKDLIEILKEYEDYDVMVAGYAHYELAVLSDIDNPSCLKHDKKWFIPCAQF